METGRDRLVCFRPIGFITLLQALEETYGSAGKAMVYRMSKTYGELLIKNYFDRIPHVNGMTLENKLEIFLDDIKNQGWGTIKITELDLYNGEVDVLLENQAFNEYCDDPGEMPQCHFIRGALEGILSAATGQDLGIKESKCIGDKRESCYWRMERNE